MNDGDDDQYLGERPSKGKGARGFSSRSAMEGIFQGHAHKIRNYTLKRRGMLDGGAGLRRLAEIPDQPEYLEDAAHLRLKMGKHEGNRAAMRANQGA